MHNDSRFTMCLAYAESASCSSLLIFSLSLSGVRPGVKPGVAAPRGVMPTPAWGVMPSAPWPGPGVLLEMVQPQMLTFTVQALKCTVFYRSRGHSIIHLNGVLRTVLGVWICCRWGVTPLKSLSCRGVLRPPFRGVSMLVRAIRFWASWKQTHEDVRMVRRLTNYFRHFRHFYWN